MVFGFAGDCKRTLLHVVEQDVDLCQGEAGKLYVEFDIDEGLELDCEDLSVPARVQCELVVGDDVCSALGGVQVREAQGWDALGPEELGSRDAAVTCDDLVLVTDQDRVGEAEALDALSDLLDLLLGVGARIAG